MTRAAVQLVGADLAQPDIDFAAENAPPYQAEAPQPDDEARRAELKAAFEMFGTLHDEHHVESAENAYRALDMLDAPANDTLTVRQLPTLARRGLHIDPKLPVQLIKALDWLVLMAAAEFAAQWGAGLGLTQMNIGSASAFVIAAVGVKAGLWLTDAYRTSPAAISAERGLGGLTLGALIGLLAANFLAPNARDAGALSATLPFAAMLLAGLHAALAVWIRAAHRKGVFADTVVIVGATDAADRFVKRANKTGEARVIAIVDDRLTRAPRAVGETPVGGDLDALLAWEGLPHVDRIVITVPQKAETRVRGIIGRLKALPNRVDLLLDYHAHGVRGRGIDRIGGAPSACVSGRPRNTGRALMKRAQDLLIGVILAALFALPALFIAVAIRLDSKGPALYRQRRHGFNNRVFTIFKFRTLRHDPGAPFERVTANDPRITRIGRLLRRSGLDELPMLFNVLRGDMSMVGPRPHAIGMTAAERALDDIVADYAHRHRVRPGITGWARINGAHGSLATPACVRKRTRLDLEYVARASLWFDLQILARTVPAILSDAKRGE